MVVRMARVKENSLTSYFRRFTVFGCIVFLNNLFDEVGLPHSIPEALFILHCIGFLICLAPKSSETKIACFLRTIAVESLKSSKSC